MATDTNTAWWKKGKEKGLQNRIQAIQQINDPTTNADEILTGSKGLIYLLLAFTGLLGGISYYKNFSGAFPAEAAIAMAFALTVTIEWGKNYCATWSLRIPFFRGTSHISSSAANTFVFIGLVCIAAATFYMSIYNSTIGGKQLAHMLSHERNQVDFTPDTKDIDTQIATLSAASEESRKTQWKGTTTRTAQKAIASNSESITALQAQRADAIRQQRADWEKNQAVIATNSNFSANLVMKSGGWVELLQALLILLRVACEKSLESRLPQEERKGGIGFQQQQRYNNSFANTERSNLPSDAEPRRPIGFYSNRSGTEEQRTVPPRTVPGKNTVEQCSPTKTTRNSSPEQQTVLGRTSTVLADVKHWEKRANQCYGRSFTQQSEAKRNDNFARCNAFIAMLQAVGVSVDRDDSRMHLEFNHPREYDTSEQAIRTIQEQQHILDQIGKKA